MGSSANIDISAVVALAATGTKATILHGAAAWFALSGSPEAVYYARASLPSMAGLLLVASVIYYGPIGRRLIEGEGISM